MSGKCSLKAHVRNEQGEVVESKLFNDLLHYAPNREIAKQYYKVGTAEEFLEKARNNENFGVDENGEITFKSLKELARIDFETDKLIETLNKDIHSGNYSYEDAIKKIQYFNENNLFSDKTLATMIPTGKGQYFVSVVPTRKNVSDNNGKRKEEAVNSDEQKKLHEVVRNKELEKKILSLLQSHKVSVNFIEGEKPGGRYSTENIVHAENGLYGLIEIMEKGNTTENLAEEAGHFAIGALGDYPLVRRLERLLSDEKVQKEALGTEEYSNTNLGTNPAREVAGKLVGKALQRKLGEGSVFNTLANRIANLAKRVFYNFTGNEVRWASAKAEQIANKIAYQFADGDSKFSVKNAIDIKETMYNAALSINVPTYKEIFNEFGRMCKKLEAISNDTFAKEMQASLGQTAIAGSNDVGKSALQYSAEHIDAMADTLAFDGIVQALVQLKDYLEPGGQIDRFMQAVDLSNPSEYYQNMARNGRYLRQARTFLRSAGEIMDLVSKSIAGNASGKTLKIGNGMTLNDVKYQDVNGTWHSCNLKGSLDYCQDIIAKRVSRLTALESSYFARFCENIYGSKYITTTTGLLWKDIWHGKDANSSGEVNISIADMVDGLGMSDIDIFHRYIGAMSNNPDIIGQIVDKVVKSANKIADDLTLKDREALIILEDRAKKLGIKMEDLFERDEEGNYTGNFITPPAQPTENQNEEEDFIFQAYLDDLQTDDKDEVYAVDHGKWERARNEFKKAKWEEFKQNYPDWETMSGFARGWSWDEFFGPEMKEWNQLNSIRVVVTDDQGNAKYVKWVPNQIYKTDAWDNLKEKYKQPQNSEDNITRWMHDYMAIKQRLDALLPPGSTLSYRAPQFRGSFGNSVRNQMEQEKGVFKKAKAFRKIYGRRAILENFIETADDQDFGDMTSMNHPDEELLGTKLDFEMERAGRLPIFGVNKLKNMTDLSTNLTASTTAYASMAYTYSALSSVVDALEVGRETMYSRKLKPRRGQKKGVKVEISPTGVYEELVTGSKNRAYGRYLKYLDKQVYGIHAPYYGLTVGKSKRILVNKIVSNLSSLAGSMFLKYNIPGGMVNTTTGFINIFKEAATGDYFDLRDWKKANQFYWSNWGSMMITNCAKIRKDDKLSLFLAQMNALSNNREKFRNFHTNRSRLNNWYRGLGYSPYSTGDHYMQSMSYLAVANGTKLYDEDGDFISNLWDAWYKTENSDDFGEFKKGATIEFKKFCPLNADEITGDVLIRDGVYIKEMSKNTSNLHTWLYSINSQFQDLGYRSQHIDEYDDYKKDFYNQTKQDLVWFQSRRYKMLKGLLISLENYLKNPTSTFTYSAEEQEYLKQKNIGTGDYQGVLQNVKEDIYNMIWTKADESAYMDKCRETNDRLHGIYNEQDKTAWHNQLYTNAFLAMKGWALGYLEYMYSPNHYSTILGKNVEGFVNTAAKIPLSAIMGKLQKDKSAMSWSDMLLTMINPWSKRSKRAMLAAGFTEEQNYNARRMVTSVLAILFLRMLQGIAAPPDDDEEKEELSGFKGLLYYMSFRAMLEQEAFLVLSEAYIQSGGLMDFVPTGIAALLDLYNLGDEAAGAMFGDIEDSDYFYQQDDRKGRYKAGDSKFKLHLRRLMPWKSMWALEHPYEAKENYEFGRKMRTR